MEDLGLNEEQAAAAEHYEGPALVVAGPGTGKTTTLVGRYLRLVERGVKPERIFCTTFTRAAAHQLKDRILATAGVDTEKEPVGTFHMLCSRLLGRIGYLVGLKGGLKFAEDKYAVLRAAGVQYQGDLTDLIDAIDRYKDRLVTPEGAIEEATKTRNPRTIEVAESYGKYQKKLSEHRMVDYGDTIALVVRAFSDYPEVRKEWSERYSFLMVDEYQDVNPAQHALITALVSSHKNLWAVGDDDQAIYGWRGSDVRYISDFTKTYSGTTVVRLKRNYRSLEGIVRVSQSLIAANQSRLMKQIQGDPSRNARVALCEADDEKYEAEWIAMQIKRRIDGGTEPKDIAVLIRVNYIGGEIQTALRKKGIPFSLRGTTPIWQAPEVRKMLRALTGIGSGILDLGVSFTYLDDRLTEIVFAETDRPFGQVAQELAEAMAEMAPYGMSKERKIEWAGNLREIAAIAGGSESPQSFFNYIRLAENEEGAADHRDSVVISTIHQAKGLEWGTVFLAGCEKEIMPHTKSDDLEEERRIAYVAVTRAKSTLGISYCSQRNRKPAGPSVFVCEMCRGNDITMLHWPVRRRDDNKEPPTSHTSAPPRKPKPPVPIPDNAGRGGHRKDKKTATEDIRAGDTVLTITGKKGTVLSVGARRSQVHLGSGDIRSYRTDELVRVTETTPTGNPGRHRVVHSGYKVGDSVMTTLGKGWIIEISEDRCKVCLANGPTLWDHLRNLRRL